MSELKRTPLHESHLASKARMVPFAGWEMPVSYAGILEEHRCVREQTGIFDVSHMGRFRVSGSRAAAALDTLVGGSVGGIEEGQFLYTMLLNERGGVIDDLLVGLWDNDYIVVVNAANLEKDWKWIEPVCRDHGCGIENETERIALIAVQGPGSREILGRLAGESDELDEMAYYRMDELELLGEPMLVSRTGYTGELGYEVYVPAELAPELWKRLLDSGAAPCGLGCRDTLRLEVGYPLYGQELDERHTPLEAGLGWTLALDKGEFNGRRALLEQKQRGVSQRLRGITSSRRDIPRPGYRLLEEGEEVGRICSGSISPSLGRGIGTAYLPVELSEPDTELMMELRGRQAPVRVVKTPFYHEGTARE